MNKLLENYNNCIDALAEYFEFEDFGNYIIQECPNYFWQKDEHGIHYGEIEEDPDYFSEYSHFLQKEDLVAVLVEDDFGGDNYWNIFYTNKEINEED